MTKWIFIVLAFGFCSAHAGQELEVGSQQDYQIQCRGSYFDWGKAQNGWGYCYQWACTGGALNGGQPVGNYNCEAYRPSYFEWGRGQDGNTYCYQWTPKGVAMNLGQPVGNYNCM